MDIMPFIFMLMIVGVISAAFGYWELYIYKNGDWSMIGLGLFFYLFALVAYLKEREDRRNGRGWRMMPWERKNYHQK